MASILNERYEVIDLQTVAEGDFTRIAYKARVLPKSTEESEGRIVLLRQLPRAADTKDVRAAAGEAASLPSSPNIQRFYGLAEIAGETDIQDGVYLVSEYSRGISLRERIRRVAPFSLAVSLDISIAICQAVLRAESFGIAHEALRPESILLTPEGQVRVGDFRIACAILSALGEESFCQDDRRAIGLLLYEMLTGVAADQVVVVDGHSPRQINPNVPPALDGIVAKATSLDTYKQYTDVSRILADLQSAREDLKAGKSLSWSPLGPANGSGVARSTARTAQATTRTIAVKPITETRTMTTRRRERNRDQDDDPDYPVWSKVLLSILAVIVIGLVFAGAYLYTILSVPSDVIVPNLIGKQYSDAQKIAASDHFVLVKAADNFSDILPAGSIYEMSPAPGRSIKAGKDVSVTVSDGPQLVAVPDLSQMTLARAEQTLTAASLPQGSVSFEYSDTVTKGIVSSQQPAADSNVAHDTPINIVVSKGPAPPVAPTGLSATSSVDGEIDLTWNDDPDAVTYNVYRDGTKLQSALPQAAYSDVNLGSGETHTYTVTGVNDNGESPQSAAVQATTLVDGSPDQTATTAPTADSSASTNTDSNGAPVETTTPSSDKQRRFEIRFRVPPNGPHNCQIEVQDTTGTNIVYDQDRQGGDIVDDNVIGFGNKIIFRIFVDGKLIRQDTL